MKNNSIKSTGNFEKDYIKAIKRYSRETFGFQSPHISKNKKKYDRNAEKMKLQRESGAFNLYKFVIFKDPTKWL